jgi:hypothetical protein
VPFARADADTSLTALAATSIFQAELPSLDDLILKHYGQTEGEQDSAETSRQTATPPLFGVP